MSTGGQTIKVGFIGLGSQGLPMAQRILHAGFHLSLWARHESSLEPFQGSQATTVETPAALGAACDVVGVCVVNDDDLRDVTLEHGLLAAMRPGTVLMVHSTVAPETVIDIGDRASVRGVGVLDAPVSGGSDAASEGRLTVMVGGDPAVLERARPVLASFGDSIHLLGALGAGQICKILNNGLFTANIKLAADTMQLGERFGLVPDAFRAVLRSGSGSSFALATLEQLLSPAGAGHAAQLLDKDVRLLHELVRAGEPTTVERVAHESVALLHETAARAAIATT